MEVRPIKKVSIFDSTLRDGAQSDGISFSLNDKLNIIRTLDELGIAFIEGGNPASNPKDKELFAVANTLELKNAQLVAFGSTRRKDVQVDEDAQCVELLESKASVICIFGKSSVFHAEVILQTSVEENLRMIEETCRYFKDHGKQVIFDAEHFFDGYLDNPTYAFNTLRAAKRGGADSITLCDTNGGTFPDEVYSICASVKREFADTEIGIHAHNDCGMATANSVMAVNAGAAIVQGTFIGFGERAGNANLSTIIPDLQIKRDFYCIPAENLSSLTSTARNIAEIANVSLHKNLPFVGRNAFTHKAGMHTDGVLKDSKAFEQISPEQVGNRRRILMSEMAGKAAVLHRVNKLYPEITKDSPELLDILEKLKCREQNGYQYEGAEGSFELIIRNVVEGVESSFELVNYKLIDELPYDNNHSSTATIKLVVNDEQTIAAAEGDGPINALDKALRMALSPFYPCLSELHLIDYKVRVMNSNAATAAVVRVLITSTDGRDIWTTVGVSKDIIEASWL
ncbi:MAG: citramalate synthase, partial [Oscillospiraceae bacterium]